MLNKDVLSLHKLLTKVRTLSDSHDARRAAGETVEGQLDSRFSLRTSINLQILSAKVAELQPTLTMIEAAMVPLRPAYVQELRDLQLKHAVLTEGQELQENMLYPIRDPEAWNAEMVEFNSRHAQLIDLGKDLEAFLNTPNNVEIRKVAEAQLPDFLGLSIGEADVLLLMKEGAATPEKTAA